MGTISWGWSIYKKKGEKGKDFVDGTHEDINPNASLVDLLNEELKRLLLSQMDLLSIKREVKKRKK